MLASLKNTLSASPSLYEDVNIFRFSLPLLQLAFVQYRAEKRTRKKIQLDEEKTDHTTNYIAINGCSTDDK